MDAAVPIATRCSLPGESRERSAPGPRLVPWMIRLEHLLCITRPRLEELGALPSSRRAAREIIRWPGPVVLLAISGSARRFADEDMSQKTGAARRHDRAGRSRGRGHAVLTDEHAYGIDGRSLDLARDVSMLGHVPSDLVWRAQLQRAVPLALMDHVSSGSCRQGRRRAPCGALGRSLSRTSVGGFRRDLVRGAVSRILARGLPCSRSRRCPNSAASRPDTFRRQSTSADAPRRRAGFVE